MDFPQPLARGRLVQRYKRFFADVVLDDGTEITAHCPNPGAMLGLNTPGLPAWVSRSDDPKRKLAHTLELVEADGGLVGINTMHPADRSHGSLVGVNTLRANALAAEAIAQSAIPELAGYDSIRREVRYGASSRVDFLLEAEDRPRCWLEVKSVTLHRGNGLAEFPDCASARGLRHVAELVTMAQAGDRSVILFVVQRADCDRFALAEDLDRALSGAIRIAASIGVEVLAYACDITTSAARISTRVELA